MKIGIVLPSRGTVFSKTMQSVWDNIQGLENVKLYMGHSLPLPDCFNEPLKRALEDGCTVIWFVEEDMLIPADTLSKMLHSYSNGALVVSVDYADRRSGASLTQRNKKGEVMYTGMGCMLVDRSVLDKIGDPWLRSVVFHLVEDDDGELQFEPHEEIRKDSYGRQDVWLSWCIRKQGIKIEMIDAKIGHMRLDKIGLDMVNNGQHKVTTVFIGDTQ